MFWPLIGWLHMSLLHLFGVCLVTMCVMIYCPHYLTSVVTPANQCVITVIIVIMFLQTRYTWRHTRPHLMTITASFLEQIILVRRYFNQIISILSLNNITSMMWPASHSKEAISSHIVIKLNIELSSSTNIFKGTASSSRESYFLRDVITLSPQLASVSSLVSEWSLLLSLWLVFAEQSAASLRAWHSVTGGSHYTTVSTGHYLSCCQPDLITQCLFSSVSADQG